MKLRPYQLAFLQQVLESRPFRPQYFLIPLRDDGTFMDESHYMTQEQYEAHMAAVAAAAKMNLQHTD